MEASFTMENTSIIEQIYLQTHQSWHSILTELITPHQSKIVQLLASETDAQACVFPTPDQMFSAFKLPKDNVKVVIIGQDSYYSRAPNGMPLANGLCFSVPQECQKCPPSLKTIFNELHHEYGVRRTNTDLNDWVGQGVLLLNCAMTVREGKPGSHMKVWKPFTHELIKHLSMHHEHVVYILWGEFAKSFGDYIDKTKNMVLECRHPSGLAASKGPFVGNNHFMLSNQYLDSHGKTTINWLGGVI